MLPPAKDRHLLSSLPRVADLNLRVPCRRGVLKALDRVGKVLDFRDAENREAPMLDAPLAPERQGHNEASPDSLTMLGFENIVLTRVEPTELALIGNSRIGWVDPKCGRRRDQVILLLHQDSTEASASANSFNSSACLTRRLAWTANSSAMLMYAAPFST